MQKLIGCNFTLLFCAIKILHCQYQQKNDEKIVQNIVMKSLVFHLFILVVML